MTYRMLLGDLVYEPEKIKVGWTKPKMKNFI